MKHKTDLSENHTGIVLPAEVKNHLDRLAQLLPKTDPQSIIKPISLAQEEGVLYDCFFSNSFKDDDDFVFRFSETDLATKIQ